MIDLECHALSTNYNRRLIEILLHNVAANLDTSSDSHFTEGFGVANTRLPHGQMCCLVPVPD